MFTGFAQVFCISPNGTIVVKHLLQGDTPVDVDVMSALVQAFADMAVAVQWCALCTLIINEDESGKGHGCVAKKIDGDAQHFFLQPLINMALPAAHRHVVVVSRQLPEIMQELGEARPSISSGAIEQLLSGLRVWLQLATNGCVSCVANSLSVLANAVESLCPIWHIFITYASYNGRLATTCC